MRSNRKSAWTLAALLLVSSLASAQVVTVSPVPGNATASGTNLLNALAGITDATAAKPYVVRLDPGTYDVGSTALAMKPYVDIEGSGQQSTIIRGWGNNSGFLTAVVLGANSAELRNLEVLSVGRGYPYSIAVLLNQVNTSVRDVTLISSGATGTSSWGLRNLGANSTVQNVTINVIGGTYGYGISNTGAASSAPVIRRAVISVSGATSGYGIYSDENASPRIRDAEITVNAANGYGIQYNYGSFLSGASLEVSNARINVTASTGEATGIDLVANDTVTVSHTNITATSTQGYGSGLRANTYYFSGVFLADHCDVMGSTYSVSAPTQIVRAGASKLDGPASIGTPTCAASFNGSYTPLSASCL
jgi:hypothetical protein